MRASSSVAPRSRGLGPALLRLPTTEGLRRVGPQDRRWMNRIIVRATAAVMVFTWWLVLTSPTLHAGHYPRWYEETGLTLLLLWYAVVVAAAVRGSADVRVLWPLPALVLVLLVGLLLVPTGPPTLQGQVWLTHPATIAVNIALLILPWRVATPLIAGIATALTLVHAEWMGLPRAAAQTAAIMVGPYLVFVISGQLLGRLLELRTASADRAAAAVRAQESRHLADQKAYWDRLIHDHVLGALILGSRATTPDAVSHARDAAAAALSSLDAPAEPMGGDDWVLQLDLFARSRGLLPTTVVTGPWAPPDVAAALASAGRQAIENVARHAGVTAVDIRAAQSHDSVALTIADAGAGFDLASVGSTRMGLHGSIPGHVAAVGGTAEVDSVPGRGTTVTLAWGRPQASARLPIVASAIFPSQNLLVVVWAGIHLLLGALYLDAVARPWVWGLGVALYLLALGVLLAGSFRRFVPAVCLALLTSSVLLAAGTEPVAAADGRLWFAGALLPPVVVLILVGRVGWGLTLGLGTATLITGTWLVLGGPAAAQGAAVAALQLVAFPLVCLLLGVALNRTAARIDEADAETARERIAAGEAAARLAEGERRREALERDAIPLLVRLRSARTLTGVDREALRVAEGAARDLLVAAPLVDDRVRAEAALARRRGARVSLSAEDPDPPSAPDGSPAPGVDRALAALRTVVGTLLRSCGAGSELVVRWHPGTGSDELASVVLDLPARPVVGEEVPPLLGSIRHELTVTPDDLFLRLLDEPAGAAPLAPTGAGTGSPRSGVQAE